MVCPSRVKRGDGGWVEVLTHGAVLMDRCSLARVREEGLLPALLAPSFLGLEIQVRRKQFCWCCSPPRAAFSCGVQGGESAECLSLPKPGQQKSTAALAQGPSRP